jgi:hypothetical protein
MGKRMKKKILIGSIIAVTILVGVSFTSVVGYRSVESNVQASPLFTIRSSRAIDEESEDLSCKYVGKEKTSFITIPKRDNKDLLGQKIINNIKLMDDKSFEKFIDLIIILLQKEDNIKKENFNEIIAILYQIRNNPSKINIFIPKSKDLTFVTASECCPTMQDHIVCKLFWMIFFVMLSFAMVVLFFYASIVTIMERLTLYCEIQL